MKLMKGAIYVGIAAVLCLSACLAFAGSYTSRGFSSGPSYSRSFSSPSFSSPRSYSTPSFSSSKPTTGSYSSPTFSSSAKPSTGSYSSPAFKATMPPDLRGPYSSKSFTPSRPVASYPSGYNPRYAPVNPPGVVEHHYYNSGPSMGNFWFWMWAFDHNNNGGGYYNGYQGQPGMVAPGGMGSPGIVVYTPLWERILIGFVNLVLVVGVCWLIIFGLIRLSRWADTL